MPPATNMPNVSADTGHMLARPKPLGEGGLAEHARAPRKSGVGPWIGIVIIVILLGFGALYFWGAYLNRQNSVDQLPFIPGDNSTQ